jgi:hypothetical protein
LENKLYAESPLMLWSGEDLVSAAAGAGFLVHSHIKDLTERRYITKRDIENWLDSDNPGTYGKALASETALHRKIKKALESMTDSDGVEWKTHHIILTLQRV